MKRYYVELKRNLKEKDSISFYMMAYNRTQIMDMLWDEYYVVALDPTEQERVMNISDMLCDMYDIQRQVKQAKLYDKPKDNDGTSFTIGDCIENVIEQLGETNEQ